jgi:hypothetical protein
MKTAYDVRGMKRLAYPYQVVMLVLVRVCSIGLLMNPYYKANHLFKHASVWLDSILWKRCVSPFELTLSLHHTCLFVLKL